MIRLDDLDIFVKAASQDSFSAVARKLDVLPAQVSAAIKRLERELDIRLFARSTRSLRLTAEGEFYLPFAREALQALHAGHEGIRTDEDQLQGMLQIACSSDLGRNVLLPWLLEYRQNHPGFGLRLSVSDKLADVYREPVDVAIRYGTLQDANYVCLPLIPDNRRVLAASPSYIARHGKPHSPADLIHHACLQYELNGKVYDKWRFPTADGVLSVTVKGPVISDDADVIRRSALAGQGIVYKSWLDISADVKSGALVVLCTDHLSEAFPLNFICPHRKQFSPAIRQLYRWIKDRCVALSLEMPLFTRPPDEAPGRDGISIDKASTALPVCNGAAHTKD
ncbi:LysR family transcriptional regulator [Pseudomonas sp. efr-133-TYG-103a]|uniref:LysR family transcriptional regulator n=1 Tax=Pseudomonas sp. efr-133-TYG-103a TaxID=3040308 RepID=UPI002556E82E|nr:LysR family transcriptional regulator [Pseudomonas sp. efr-133-TYG-103a]